MGIYYDFMENSSQQSLLNFSFCVPQKKKKWSHKGLEWNEGGVNNDRMFIFWWTIHLIYKNILGFIRKSVLFTAKNCATTKPMTKIASSTKPQTCVIRHIYFLHINKYYRIHCNHFNKVFLFRLQPPYRIFDMVYFTVTNANACTLQNVNNARKDIMLSNITFNMSSSFTHTSILWWNLMRKAGITKCEMFLCTTIKCLGSVRFFRVKFH